MNIHFNKREPVYKQVVKHFKEQIATGMFEPGQEIPSRRELAKDLKINPNTAQRAYKEMEGEGLIYTERNLPSRITKDKAVLTAVKGELVEEAVDAFVQSISKVDVSLDDVMILLKEKYQGKYEEDTQ